MNRRQRIIITVVALYALAAVITFGHAAAHYVHNPRKFGTKEECTLMAGIGGALFWPLYWSWSAWESAR